MSSRSSERSAIRRHALLLSVPVAALLLTACSTESVVENLTEEVVERASDGDVQIDSDEGSVTIETEDGTSTLTQTEELPDDFPADLPVPDGFVPSTVQTIEEGGERTLLVQGEITDPVAAYESIAQALPAAGYEVTVQSEGLAQRQLTFTGPDGTEGLIGVIGAEGDEDGLLQYFIGFGG